MLVSAIFIIVVFNVLALLCFFIAKESPKGKFKSWNYDRLPGIMTANTLRSREAWVAAHQATSSNFMLLAVYFTLCAVVNLILLWEQFNINGEAVFTVSLLVGIAIFAVLVFKGDRVAAKLNQ